jgi:prolyl 4-hydroxylase
MSAMNSSAKELTQLDAACLAGLRERMRLGTDMSAAVTWLRGQGYTDRAILAGFEAVRPRGDAFSQGVENPPLLRRSPPNLRRVATSKLTLYLLDDFLSPDDCARLVSLVSSHLNPSETTYVIADKEHRTSTTAYLCHLRHPLAMQIDDRICRTLGIRAEYGEGAQAQRYDVGQQFKAHWDCFEPNTVIYQRMAGVRGNRTWTFMVYLNEGMEGGATRFTEIDYAVQPKRGMALFWNNLNPDGSPNEATKHAGEPVISGHKVIITKWFRAMGDGPLFHDQAPASATAVQP